LGILSKKIDLKTFYVMMSQVMGMKDPPKHFIPICEILEDESIEHIQIIVAPGSGKSQLVSIFYPVWLLAQDPTQTILGVSAGRDLIRGFLNAVSRIIEFDPHYHKLFPHIEPDKDSGWSEIAGLYVKGHLPGSPDPSYFATGLGTSIITGKHCRTMIIDDVHDAENSASIEQCEKVKNFYYHTLLGRADPKGCRYIVAGRRWSPNDIYGHFMHAGHFVTLILPAFRESQEIYWDCYVPETSKNIITEYLGKESEPGRFGHIDGHRYFKIPYGKSPTGFFWPGNKQKEKEVTIEVKSAPHIAQALYFCDPQPLGGSIFKVEDIQYADKLPDEPPNYVISAWDTSFGTGKANTAGYVAYLYRCDKNHNPQIRSSVEEHYDVYVVDRYVGDWKFAELVDVIVGMNNKYRPHAVIIENRSTGITLAQMLPQYGVPVVPIMPKSGKALRAIEVVTGSHGSVQGWFRLGRVKLLRGDWNRYTEEALLTFNGETSASLDDVDALVYLVSHAIKLGISGNVQTMEVRPPSNEQAPAGPMGMLDEIKQNIHESNADPVQFAMLEFFNTDEMCMTCINYDAKGSMCKLLQVRKRFFDSCPRYSSKELFESGPEVDW
jgi:predicted phage terminase large subunit-like protein